DVPSASAHQASLDNRMHSRYASWSESPSNASSGTFTSVSTTRDSSAARRPIDGSASTSRPSVPDSTTNIAGPEPSTSAPMTNSSDSAARTTADFTPLRTNPPGTLLAFV